MKHIICLKHLVLPLGLFSSLVFIGVFLQQSRDWLLPVLFLLLPYVDLAWQMPAIIFVKQIQVYRIMLLVATVALLLWYQPYIDIFITMVISAAIPEEWFFRAYLQKRLGGNMMAVLLASVMFSLMHFITRGSVVGLLVFVPSVLFGWVYKKTGDMVLVVMLHALSNLVYYIYLESYLIKFIE